MTYNECPCNGCVCIPVCRHKLYTNLVRDCAMLKEYIVNYNKYTNSTSRFQEGDGFHHRVSIQKFLKPADWSVTRTGLFIG